MKNNQSTNSLKYIPAEIPREAHKNILKLSIDLDISAKELYGVIIPLGFHVYNLFSGAIALSAKGEKISPRQLNTVIKDCIDLYEATGSSVGDFTEEIQKILEHLMSVGNQKEQQVIEILTDELFPTSIKILEEK